jgi:hypothetical protein
MNFNKSIFALGVLTWSASVAASVPDFSNCVNRTNGSMEYGKVPWACDSDVYGTDDYVQGLYGALILAEADYTPTEVSRYMTGLFATIRDASAYYLKTREPRATAAEIQSWQRSIYAVLSRESLWSHFRIAADGRLKITRGDSAHGFGLMQIDDRYHAADIATGQAWDLIGNTVLGMDIYYDAWKRAATASCVSSPSQWENRARAAYSYYNGGSDLCRWTHAKNTWAANDNGFKAAYDSRPWTQYVNDSAFTSPVDVECAIESQNVEKTECITQEK